MLSPFGCGFQEVVTNQSAPSATPGTSIVPGTSNALGSYTEILSDTVLTSDAYGIWLLFHTNNFATEARPSLINIGADPAGGTAYSDIITDLNACCAADIGVGAFRGLFYYFPLFIKAGTALAARARTAATTARTLRVMCRLFCKPTRPELLRCGAYVDSIGGNTATSAGTAITPGVSAAEGTYVSLGTLPRPAWWFQQGLSINDASMGNLLYHVDLAYGNPQKNIIADQIFTSDTSERLHAELRDSPDCMIDLASGTELFARASISTATNDTAVSVVAHALGG